MNAIQYKIMITISERGHQKVQHDECCPAGNECLEKQALNSQLKAVQPNLSIEQAC